jgi:hypothetical protein
MAFAPFRAIERASHVIGPMVKNHENAFECSITIAPQRQN